MVWTFWAWNRPKECEFKVRLWRLARRSDGRTRENLRMPNNHESIRRSDAPATWVLALGMMLMLVAFASCAVLSWSHSRGPVVGCGGGVELGRCGPSRGSGCDRAKDSIWSLPVVGWPTAHIGMAWFAAMAQCWTIGRGRWWGQCGCWDSWAVASLFLIGVMLVEGYLCRWCAIAHGANLAFLALAPEGGRKGRKSASCWA